MTMIRVPVDRVIFYTTVARGQATASGGKTEIEVALGFNHPSSGELWIKENIDYESSE